jgi:hypothetical protein
MSKRASNPKQKSIPKINSKKVIKAKKHNYLRKNSKEDKKKPTHSMAALRGDKRWEKISRIC